MPILDRAGDLPRSIVRTLDRSDLAKTAVYVVLSSAAALAGSLAAVFLVPLVQPKHALPFAGRMLEVRGGNDMQIVVFIAAAGAFALLRWQAARLGAYLVGRYGMSLRQQVHARLIDAPLADMSKLTSAEIANVLTYNIEIIVQGFSALQQLLVVGVTSAVSLGFAICVSPPLMLAVPILAALGLIASRTYGREQAMVSQRYVADMTRLFWQSEDFPRRLRHVRSFGREGTEKASYGGISEQLAYGYRRQLELVASGRLMLELLATFGIAAAFALAHRWHAIDQSALIAVCLLLGRLLPYLVSTRQSVQQLRSAAPAIQLWQRYMELGPVQTVASSQTAPAADAALHIRRLRVTPPLVGLEVEGLVLQPGQLTLVSGDSGIGKSCLIDVLAGMMHPETFVAHMAERPIDFETYRGLIRHAAYVSQNVRPWQSSVRECLLWVEPAATEAVMWCVLTEVGLNKLLIDACHGLDTPLHGPSSRLSGGELQRLMLAQVILRKPFLALLDEATSALDAASEIAVLSTLKRCLPQTVLIVVSHRVSAMDIADQCLVIDANHLARIHAKPSLSRVAP